MLRYQPSLRTDRLFLRPFVAEDAPPLHRLAGAREIADTTISIPHPYSLGAAKSWIAGLPHFFRNETALHFAVCFPDAPELIGAVALRDIDREHSQAELSFWMGVGWWGEGYASESALAVTRFGFEELSLNRIYAYHMLRNPVSGKVLHKLGMEREGVLRQRVRKWDRFEDVALCALLRGGAGAVRAASDARQPADTDSAPRGWRTPGPR